MVIAPVILLSFLASMDTPPVQGELLKCACTRERITKLLSLHTATLFSQLQDVPARGQHGVVA